MSRRFSSDRASAAAALVVTATLTAGCKHPPADQDRDGSARSGDASLSGSDAAGAAGADGDGGRAHGPKGALAPCRATTPVGFVKWANDNAVIADGTPLNSEIFVHLGKEAHVVARDPRSLRETQFFGPGYVRACVGSLEQSEIVSGSFQSIPGSGESPGHEEWVVTGSTVIRYSAATVHLDAAALDGVVDVYPRGGDSFVWVSRYASLTPTPTSTAHAGRASSATSATGPTASPHAWLLMTTTADGGAPPHYMVKPSAALTTANVVAECTTLADEAAKAGSHLRDAGAGFGPAAARHVSAFREARAACAIAELHLSWDAAEGTDPGAASGVTEAHVLIARALERAKLGETAR